MPIFSFQSHVVNLVPSASSLFFIIWRREEERPMIYKREALDVQLAYSKAEKVRQ